MTTLILVPREYDRSDTAGMVRYGTSADLVNAIAGAGDETERAIIVSDGLDAGELETVATAVRDWGGACIEVRSERWDGATFSPLSAACRGVISGFGADGLTRAMQIQ